jgi:hypothetical protein
VRTLYFHIGPAKTATSAIQHLLSTTPVSNIVYPKVGLWSDGSHHNFVFNFFGAAARPEIVRTPVQTLLCQLRDCVEKTTGNVLISSEALCEFPDACAFIECVATAIGDLISEIEVVAVFREHFERAASLYNQMVKDHFYCEHRSPDDFLRTAAGSVLYDEILSRFISKKVTLINYHPAGTFCERFLSSIGVRGCYARTPRNRSICVTGLIALLVINQIVRCGPEREAYFAALRRMDGFFSGSRFIFGREAVQEIWPIFHGDRQKLQSRWGIEMSGVDIDTLKSTFFLTPKEVNELSEVILGSGRFDKQIIDVLKGYERHSEAHIE